QIILHKLPPHVQENKMHIYDPMVLSIGPYHHSRLSEIQKTEEIKEEIVNLTLNSNGKDFFVRKILKRIDGVRYFYGGISTHEFDDDALAQMMLRDTCLVLYYIKLMLHDFLMLENQIPFWIIKLLIDFTIEDGDELLCTFLNKRFNSNFLYGELCLPILYVTGYSKVFFYNTITFEMSSESKTDYTVASYITFIKTLIENTRDVKELKRKDILFGTLANDDE
ncbi:hypothetical protein MIMGU_mgv1a021945mg, partial [Erythranthe guttata]